MANIKRRTGSDPDPLNPYIALSDLMISLVLIIVFFVALGKLNLINIRYKRAMDAFAKKVETLPANRRPRRETGRNDPPGVQRWVFDGRELFVPVAGESDLAPPRLTPEGERSLARFAVLLAESDSRSQWKRIRVEGHTLPFYETSPDEWELSARRAAVVVRQIQIAGRIEPFYCAVAGRAGQNPLHKLYLVCPMGDPQGVALRQSLAAAKVRYTYKPWNQAGDVSAKSATFATQNKVFLTEQDGSGQERFYQAERVSLALPNVVAHFKQNERVEVLIEYATKK